jgi:hypothetical protein
MTGEADVSISTLQPATQQGTRCLGRRRDGGDCGMTPTAVSGGRWCPKHDPARRHLLAEEARTAARASHAPRLTPELEAWADAIDWDDEAGVHQSLREAFVLLAKRGLTPAQAAAMAQLAGLRLRGFQAKAPPRPGAIVVEVAKYGAGNGQAPAEEAAS